MVSKTIAWSSLDLGSRLIEHKKQDSLLGFLARISPWKTNMDPENHWYYHWFVEETSLTGSHSQGR